MAFNILEIPELRMMVIQLLKDDKKALKSAILVNKTWAAQAISIKWESIRAGFLVDWVERCRRQQYAFHVKRLSFQIGDENCEQYVEPDYVNLSLFGLEFPRLESLVFCPETDTLPVAQYLQPNLKDLVHRVSIPEEDVLHLLETRCPRLQKVHLSCDYEQDRMISLLQHRKLKSVRLTGSSKTPSNDEFLSFLACYDGLEDLKLSEDLSLDDVDKIFKASAAPFKDLISLGIKANPTTVPTLMENIKNFMPKLRCLDLETDKNEISNMPYVGLLSNLQRLTLEIVRSARWDGKSLEGLKSLTNLHELEISAGPDSRSLYDPSMTDDDFITLFKDMNKLEKLKFHVACPLITINALAFLGQNCRRLAFCIVPGTFVLADIDKVAGTFPLFPELRELSLTSAVDRDGGLG